MLKPVLIGFILGLLLVGLARLVPSGDDAGPLLTGAGAHGSAYQHVSRGHVLKGHITGARISKPDCTPRRRRMILI